MNVSSLTTNQWLAKATTQLGESGIGTARLDALVLLEDLLNTNRTQIIAHPEVNLTDEQVLVLDQQIARRSKHEPLAYIRGRTEFYGREFLINNNVLEPRPESETIIDLLKALHLKQPFSLVDVGAGSGCLGITAKLEMPMITVDMLELSDAAIKICEKNKQHLKTEISVQKSDLLESAPGQYDVVLANLPYVPDHYQINEAAAMEPRMAIFGGTDGLDLYRKLFRQLDQQEHVQYVLTESLPFQHKALLSIAKQYGYTLQLAEDFIQVFKKLGRSL